MVRGVKEVKIIESFKLHSSSLKGGIENYSSTGLTKVDLTQNKFSCQGGPLRITSGLG